MSFCSTNLPMRQVCWIPKSDLSTEQSVTKFLSKIVVNLVMLKDAIKHELFLNKLTYEAGLLNTYIRLKQQKKVWTNSYKKLLWIWLCLKMQLSLSFCSTNLPMRQICWTPKSDLSRRRKCEQIHINDCYEFGHTWSCI